MSGHNQHRDALHIGEFSLHAGKFFARLNRGDVGKLGARRIFARIVGDDARQPFAGKLGGD